MCLYQCGSVPICLWLDQQCVPICVSLGDSLAAYQCVSISVSLLIWPWKHPGSVCGLSWRHAMCLHAPPNRMVMALPLAWCLLHSCVPAVESLSVQLVRQELLPAQHPGGCVTCSNKDIQARLCTSCGPSLNPLCVLLRSCLLLLFAAPAAPGGPAAAHTACHSCFVHPAVSRHIWRVCAGAAEMRHMAGMFQTREEWAEWGDIKRSGGAACC